MFQEETNHIYDQLVSIPALPIHLKASVGSERLLLFIAVDAGEQTATVERPGVFDGEAQVGTQSSISGEFG
jgi:hypothetical protein